MNEQRKHKRAKVGFAVTVRSVDGQEIQGQGRDLSLGGMFVECDATLPFGAPVEVRFVPPAPSAKEEVAIPGVCRWTQALGMGIQFGLFGVRETYLITEILREGAGDE
jgi:PilZ domain